MTQAKFQRLAYDGLLDHVCVPFELIADSGADEVSTVRIKTLAYHQVDMPQIDVSEVHRNFLGVTGLLTQIVNNRGHCFHPCTILLDGIWMVHSKFQGVFRKGENVRISPRLTQSAASFLWLPQASRGNPRDTPSVRCITARSRMSGFILVIAEFPTAGNRRRWADTMAQAACASRDTNTTNFIAPS